MYLFKPSAQRIQLSWSPERADCVLDLTGRVWRYHRRAGETGSLPETRNIHRHYGGWTELGDDDATTGSGWIKRTPGIAKINGWRVDGEIAAMFPKRDAVETYGACIYAPFDTSREGCVPGPELPIVAVKDGKTYFVTVSGLSRVLGGFDVCAGPTPVAITHVPTVGAALTEARFEIYCQHPVRRWLREVTMALYYERLKFLPPTDAVRLSADEETFWHGLHLHPFQTPDGVLYYRLEHGICTSVHNDWTLPELKDAAPPDIKVIERDLYLVERPGGRFDAVALIKTDACPQRRLVVQQLTMEVASRALFGAIHKLRHDMERMVDEQTRAGVAAPLPPDAGTSD